MLAGFQPPHVESDANHLTTIQVLRYSALVAGLVYGVYHQSSITSQAKRAEIEHEYSRKERLIEQAKAEWKKKTMPQETQTQASGRMLPFRHLPILQNKHWPSHTCLESAMLTNLACSHYRSRKSQVRFGGIPEGQGCRVTLDAMI